MYIRRGRKPLSLLHFKHSDDSFIIHEFIFREKYEEEKSKKTSTGSTEAPRIDISKKMRPFDESRIYLILEFFTSHFIEMAKKSNEYRNKGQSYFYMQAAKNLLKVLDVSHRQTSEGHQSGWKFPIIKKMMIKKSNSSGNAKKFFKYLSLFPFFSTLMASLS